MQDLGRLLQQARDEYIGSHPAKEAEILEYYSVHQERFRHLLKNLVLDNQKDKPRLKILDVGCYPPHFGYGPFKIGL